jgi:Zn-dependent membrane protease YugP
MGRRGMRQRAVSLSECDYDGVSIRPVTVTVESKCKTVQGEAKRPSVGVLRSIVSAAIRLPTNLATTGTTGVPPDTGTG